MPVPRTSLLCACLAVLAAAPSAQAGDYYVSVNGGDDLNDGLSPATAWKTLSFALANVPLTDPSGLHTLHVAPGTYSALSGEAFPLQAEAMIGSGAADIEIVSDSGSAATTILGAGTTTISIRSRRLPDDGPFFRSRITRLQGFHITPPSTGIVVRAVGGNLSPLFEDLVIEGGSGSGMSFGSVGDSFVGTSGDVDNAMVVDCEVYGFAGNGVEVSSFGDLLIFTSCTVTFTDTIVRDNAGHGLRLDAEDSTTDAILLGCRVVGNGQRGVYLNSSDFNFGDAELNATGTLIARNDAGGCALDGIGFGFGGPFVVLQRCTVADNLGPGVEGIVDTSEVDVDTSILYGNTIDLDGIYASSAVEFSDVGTGDAGGSGTNIGADPLFVDRANGDFRLRDTSPCIDAGNPAQPLDADGTTADMGALSFDQDAATTYCTGKTNSLGCVPFVTWTGFASASAPQAFRIRAVDVLPDQALLILYSFKKANLGFHGGRLCVKAPFQRFLPLKTAKSGGLPPCTGTSSRNFNSRIQSGVDAMLTPGQTVFAQWRGRDPGDPAGFGDGLTNALRFTIAP